MIYTKPWKNCRFGCDGFYSLPSQGCSSIVTNVLMETPFTPASPPARLPAAKRPRPRSSSPLAAHRSPALWGPARTGDMEVSMVMGVPQSSSISGIFHEIYEINHPTIKGYLHDSGNTQKSPLTLTKWGVMGWVVSNDSPPRRPKPRGRVVCTRISLLKGQFPSCAGGSIFPIMCRGGPHTECIQKGPCPTFYHTLPVGLVGWNSHWGRVYASSNPAHSMLLWWCGSSNMQAHPPNQYKIPPRTQKWPIQYQPGLQSWNISPTSGERYCSNPNSDRIYKILDIATNVDNTIRPIILSHDLDLEEKMCVYVYIYIYIHTHIGKYELPKHRTRKVRIKPSVGD